MEIPLGNVVTGIATVIAVVIANRLTYSRSTKERLWDLRRQAYGVILAELGAADRIIHGANKYIASGVGDYFESKYFADDIKKTGEHMKVAHDRFSDDYLIFSDDFVRIFEAFLGERDDAGPNVAGHNEHLRRRSVITKYRPLLLAQARSEMKIRPRWWRFHN
jgi:hypothetical protein